MRATPIQGIRHKLCHSIKIEKLGLVLKFSIVFPLSRYIILTFVKDFKSISVLRKEISNLEAEKKSSFFTLLSPKLVLTRDFTFFL